VIDGRSTQPRRASCATRDGAQPFAAARWAGQGATAAQGWGAHLLVCAANNSHVELRERGGELHRRRFALLGWRALLMLLFTLLCFDEHCCMIQALPARRKLWRSAASCGQGDYFATAAWAFERRRYSVRTFPRSSSASERAIHKFKFVESA